MTNRERFKTIRHEDGVFAPVAKTVERDEATQDMLEALPLLAFTLGIILAALFGL